MKMLVLMMGMISATLSFAQESTKQERVQKTPEERAANVTARMKEKLGLSTEQESKISAINLKYAQKHQTIRDNSSLAKEEKKSQLDASRTALMAEYKTVLTADQYKKLEEMKAKHEERKAGEKPPKGSTPPSGTNAGPPEEEL